MSELAALLLPAVPLLVLLVMLLAGRYPGCEAIVRLAERITAWCRSRFGAASRWSVAPGSTSFFRGGGMLLALSLSGRAPPAAA